MSMKAYTDAVNTKKTPQSQAVMGKTQVKNNAGGFTFKLGDWERLDRFLILGSEGGTYYVAEKKLTQDNAECVLRCLSADGPRTVARIVEVSEAGRAPKNDAAVFALALALKLGDAATKAAAKAAVPKVCRIGTHLFGLADAVKALGGWGRGTKAAFGSFYTSKAPADLALQLVKYQSRNGWAHRDILRQTHLKPKDITVSNLLKWSVGKMDVDALLGGKVEGAQEAYDVLVGFERAKKATTAKEVVALIEKHALPRECIPTQFLNEAAVWDALLHSGKHGMPITALVRNLAKMTAVGLIKPLSEASKYIAQRLADGDELKRARVHPVTLLFAQKTYAQGHGEKGKLSWSPDQKLVTALDSAFYLAFKAVEPTGKNHLLALDVSGSMGGAAIAGTSLTAREAAAAMALVTLNTEANTHIIGFTSGGGRSFYDRSNNAVTPLAITPKMTLGAVCNYTAGLPFGGTDAALPMLYATKHKLEVDAFFIYTDNETYAGSMHPFQALEEYRQKMGRPAKMVAVGLTATEHSVCDPSDAGSMNVVGFDTATPSLMADFVR